MPGTQANVGGQPVNFPFGTTGALQVPLLASQMAQTGTLSITLTNPGPGGGASNAVAVKVIPGSNYVRTVNLPANDLVWNSQQQLIYASIAASSSSNPSSIVAIDPTSGKVLSAQAMPAEPSLLAISGDQQYLYVGMTSIYSIARLKLPGLTPDIQWKVSAASTGSYPVSISDIEVAPGQPHTIAVPSPPGAWGMLAAMCRV